MTKKHKVVLVPAVDKTAPIGQFKDGLKLSTINCIIPFHIYILSDGKIKEGDWFLDWNNKQDSGIQKCTKRHLESFKDSGILCKNIVSSSDASLGLPLVPDTFEKYYVDQHNLGNVIKEVDVEYNESYKTGWIINGQEKRGTIEGALKINSDNTIKISVPSVSDSLDEAATRYSLRELGQYEYEEYNAFKAGAIWQKTSCNTYNEDEVANLLAAFKMANEPNSPELEKKEYPNLFNDMLDKAKKYLKQQTK